MPTCASSVMRSSMPLGASAGSASDCRGCGGDTTTRGPRARLPVSSRGSSPLLAVPALELAAAPDTSKAVPAAKRALALGLARRRRAAAAEVSIVQVAVKLAVEEVSSHAQVESRWLLEP